MRLFLADNKFRKLHLLDIFNPLYFYSIFNTLHSCKAGSQKIHLGRQERGKEKQYCTGSTGKLYVNKMYISDTKHVK